MQGIIPQLMMLHFVSERQSEVDGAVSALKERSVETQPAGPGNVGAYVEDPDGNAIYLSIP